MKVDCKNYRGIEYVQFQELPQLQQEKLLQTPDHGSFIKILIDGKIVGQCLQYKDYSLWYENVYKQKTLAIRESKAAEVVDRKANLVAQD
jgi:hypothetical protein